MCVFIAGPPGDTEVSENQWLRVCFEIYCELPKGVKTVRIT